MAPKSPAIPLGVVPYLVLSMVLSPIYELFNDFNYNPGLGFIALCDFLVSFLSSFLISLISVQYS
jgi:hypothetical protein